MTLLERSHPALAPDPDLGRARRLLEDYAPRGAEQKKLRRAILDFLDQHPHDAHRRTSLEGHLTASALVVEEGHARVLLTHHKKLGKWLQLGGHADGDANLPGVALREAIEESGISRLAIDPRPFDLDVHVIPERPGEPEHLHLDTRFLAVAPRGAEPVLNHESYELRWLEIGEALELAGDDSVARLVRLAAKTAPQTHS